ncbi:MAG TPA: tetratricopeptide repeat protein [Pontiella sp.]
MIIHARKILLPVAMLVTSLAASPKELLKTGERVLKKNRFNDAIQGYEEAIQTDPSASEPYVNLGQKHYRKGDFEVAAKAYKAAALLSHSDYLRSRCWYNMANCMVKSGQKLQQENPDAAHAYCQQAISLYRMALRLDIHFSDAAYNLEVSHKIALRITEEIRKQEELQKQKNALMQYLHEKLTEYIARQTQLIKTGEVGHLQQVLKQETYELAETMRGSGLHEDVKLPDETQIPSPLKATYKHTLMAVEAMVIPDQQSALRELISALEAMPASPSQSDDDSEDSEDYESYDRNYKRSDQSSDSLEEGEPFGNFSEYEELRGVPPPNQTEMDILAEEIRNQERRKQNKAGKYQSAEKDW